MPTLNKKNVVKTPRFNLSKVYYFIGPGHTDADHNSGQGSTKISLGWCSNDLKYTCVDSGQLDGSKQDAS